MASFCKVPAVVTIAGQWFDYSTAARSPVPNYYASSPTTAAVLDGEKGLPTGPACAPASKFLSRLHMINSAAAATTTSSQNQPICVLDYLLYYPFIDMDAAGEDQGMTNVVTLPRYTDGAGVRMMLVAQATTIGGGTFTVTYTNQAGVAGRVTPSHFCAAAQPFGALVSASGAAGGVTPFLQLQDGDSGVRSVQSVNFSLANGGLAALVLVRPITMIYSMEESRRTTTGTLESFGSVSVMETMSMRAPTARIYDDSYIHFIGQTVAGSVSGTQMCGIIETAWN
jgi:hypothetical protein